MTQLGPAPTARQRDVIRRTDRHVLVAAGPGAGGTFVVVRRMLQLLSVPLEGVPPRSEPARSLADIAVITLTDTLAVELRELLRAALLQAGRETDALAVDTARIGTIRHFCGELLREHALRGGHHYGGRRLDLDRLRIDARDLLTGSAEILASTRRQLHTLIVDEYQDADPLTHELAWLLADPLRGGPLTPRLLLVGDPAQRLVRSRDAALTRWRETERQFRDGAGEVILLDVNHRSVPAILNFVGATVRAELSDPLDGAALTACDVVPAEPVRTDSGEAAVEVLLIPPAADDGRRAIDDARALEAEAVARRARAFHDAGVAWRSMAVLLPDWTSVAVYDDALERHGVPHYCLQRDGFFERREVLDCLLALQAISDPTDDRAVVGWLRSPFVALRDDTLLALATCGIRPIAEALHAPGLPETERRAWAAATLAAHSSLRDRIPTRDLLESLLDESGYMAHLATLGERQAVANVRRFLARVGRADSYSLDALLRVVDQERQAGQEITDARLCDADENVVTITTIRAAKRRAWDVVFWADVRQLPADEGDAFERGERRRLWYITATTARSHLVVSGIAQGHGKILPDTAEDMLLRRLPILGKGRTGVHRVGRGGGGFALRVRIAGSETTERTAPRRELPLSAPPGPVRVSSGGRRQSAASLQLFQRCPERHWFRHTAGLAEPDADPERRVDDQPDREAVLREVALVEQHAGYRGLRNHPTAHRELRFVELLGPDRFLEGVVELAALLHDGYALLGVKTGLAVVAQTAADRAAEYQVEADAHIGAIETISGLPVTRFAFHFSRTAEQQVSLLDPAARLAARERIRELLSRLASGERTLATAPGECLRCGYKMAGWCPGVVNL